jgi:hypothetical protein
MTYDELKSTVQNREPRDCVIVALSLLTNFPYADIQAAIDLIQPNRTPGKGIYLRRAFEALDTCYNIHACSVYEYGISSNNLLGLPKIPTTRRSKIGYYRIASVKQYTNRSILPYVRTGKYLISYHGHVAACINGKIEDWSNNRCLRIQEIFVLRDQWNDRI